MNRPSDNREPKLLILYASFGEGHLQAARAIQSAMENRGIRRTVLVDLLAEAHPWINEMARRVYMKSFTLLPGLYGWVYDVTKPMKHDSLFAGWLHSFGRERLRRLLRYEKPDAVFHTFPLLAMPALRERIGIHIPTYAVVTDFDLHRRWVHPDIGRYYVPTVDMRHELIALGIPGTRICVSGIPLKAGFGSVTVEPALRAKYGIPGGSPTVLVMAGAYGVLSGIESLCASLLEQPELIIALVCGHNEPLADSMRELFKAHPESDRLRIFGYIEQMHELMALSTCIVTKPGGVTLAEALASGLPIFLHRPVPGQERNNALFLESKGAAIITRSSEQLAHEIMKLFGDPIRLRNSKRACMQLQRSQAADTIALDFLSGFNIMEGAASNGRR